MVAFPYWGVGDLYMQAWILMCSQPDLDGMDDTLKI